MSAEASPKGKPDNPPIPNIGRNASAKNIGTVKRIDAPHNDKNKHARIMTDGMEMIIVVAWKNALIAVPIPVIYM